MVACAVELLPEPVLIELLTDELTLLVSAEADGLPPATRASMNDAIKSKNEGACMLIQNLRKCSEKNQGYFDISIFEALELHRTEDSKCKLWRC
ncbi:hypothetical protein NB231_02208 [Nitrococcus mobilis Nb-231]|uniref:Uncharacterized protein n=1 Tax=Nitrococcus mobilis Nb-231 TaxID=314278 RepID=A4BUH8_9GAMM|nr:hypothetical protein NB231_02208 [Nitrococcus mobilis Nb-231]